MALDPRTPVVIGVGQVVNRDEGGIAEATEPAGLMVEALRAAEADCGTGGVLSRAGVVAAVPVISWRYQDPGRIVADAVGASDATTWYPSMGGNTPQMLVTRLAAAVADGQVDLGVVVGAEAYRSRVRAKKAGTELAWTRQDDDVEPGWSEGSGFVLGHPAEMARGIMMPTQTYPLLETALWHDSGRTLDEHLEAVGRMWAGFSDVAADNPYAWRRERFTAAEITTPTPDNRLVGFPYTKRMVSNPDVDMGAGCIVCSVAEAEALGVRRDRWVFPHAGTDGRDPLLSERPDFTGSPSMAVAGNRVLELAGIGIDDVHHLDLYSCFPSAVQLACRELGLDPADDSRPLTVYGGLCFAGGPWNNPVGHAIAAMVQVLRADPGSVGLVTANGGNVEKHAFGVYSTDPPAGGFRHQRPQDEIDARGRREVVEDHLGPAAIEGWTVMHERDGSPSRAHASCLTPDGRRAWGVSTDPEVMKRFSSEDVGGGAVTLGPEGELELT